MIPHIHVTEGGDPKGDPAGAPVVFLHALGLDSRMWGAVWPLLPRRARLIGIDLRGHGQSDVPPAPYAMGALIRDVERAMDERGLRDAVVVGLSVGGLIAQGLAAKRLDLVRALVLSNTAAKIGTRAQWDERAALVREKGVGALADGVLARWFGARTRDSDGARAMAAILRATPPEGYAGVAAAIGGTDFITTTSGLRLPTLVIAGTEDGSTPPDLVRELAELIPGARHELIRGAGHLPPVDQPEAFATLLTAFLRDTGHV